MFDFAEFKMFKIVSGDKEMVYSLDPMTYGLWLQNPDRIFYTKFLFENNRFWHKNKFSMYHYVMVVIWNWAEYHPIVGCDQVISYLTDLLKYNVQSGVVWLFFNTMHTFFIRNFYWDSQIAKKLSVLKPQKLRNFYFFFHFQYHNFEDIVTNFDKDMFRNLFVVQTLTVKWISNLKVSLIVFNYKTMFSFACCSILRKCQETVKKLWVLQITKSLETFTVLGPDLSFW